MTIFSQELEVGLARFMAERGIDRDEAMRQILGDWLASSSYLGGNGPSADETVKETVQYPEFMEDASGGAGG